MSRARPPPLERDSAPSDLAAGRPPWRRCLPLRRLAGRGGAVLVAGAAARPTRSVSLAVQVEVGLRGLAGIPGFAFCTGFGWGGFGLCRPARVLGWRLGPVRRRTPRGRGPGAVRPRVGGSAALLLVARDSVAGGCGDLCGARQ